MSTKLHAAGNQISVIFRSPVGYITTRYRARPLHSSLESIPGGTYIRKAACHFGWDWGPQLPSIGIWKEIRLEGFRRARLAEVHLRQFHEEGRVRVEAAVEIDRWEPGALQARMEVISPTGEVSSQAVAVGGSAGLLRVEIARPEYWWPNGYGAQPLFAVKLDLLEEGLELDQRSFEIGLRTVELRREPDPWGESFTFVVNGVPVFVKGSNWIPPDPFPNRITGARLEKLISSAAAANQNMLRVWGGGIYEEDRFYELCDRLGILVWQDFMFACGIYPLDDPVFKAGALAEIRENVQRLRHRASLALWCGNNEIEVGWAEWGWSHPGMASLKTAYRQFFYEELPALLAREDPGRAYWPSSPSSGAAFDHPNSSDRGDAHYWEVWHGRKPFSEYLQQFPRFMSEFGFQALPPLSTIETFTDPEDRNLTSAVMEHHQRSGVGNELILSQLAAHFRVPSSFDALVYVSMLLQAEGIRYGVEHWRRSKQRVSGVLYWQLNDTWPAISWSSIDYFGRWKALHYAARRFYAPVLLSAGRAGNRITLHLTSDLREPVEGAVAWQLEDLNGRVIQRGEQPVRLAPLESALAADLDFSAEVNPKTARKTILVASFLRDGKAVSTQVVPFVRDKHLDLQDPHLDAELTRNGDRFTISVTAVSLARFVELSFQDQETIFTDNYFDLPAGRTVEVSASLPAGWSEGQARAALKMRSLFDSY